MYSADLGKPYQEKAASLIVVTVVIIVTVVIVVTVVTVVTLVTVATGVTEVTKNIVMLTIKNSSSFYY